MPLHQTHKETHDPLSHRSLLMPAGSSCFRLLLGGAWEPGDCSQPALRRPGRGGAGGSESLGNGPGPRGTALSSSSERRAELCPHSTSSAVLKSDRVSSHSSNPPRGPLGEATPMSAVDSQSVCMGTAMLVSKILRCFKTIFPMTGRTAVESK